MKAMVKKILGIVLIFIIGFLSAQIIPRLQISEKPFSVGFIGAPSAPSELIDRENIQVYSDRVVIYVRDAKLATYADTGSMMPVLDDKTKGIRIPVTSPEQISIGDIITYVNENNEMIVHRVIDIGLNKDGVYYLTKGDSNLVADSIVYFSQIKYKVAALVY